MRRALHTNARLIVGERLGSSALPFGAVMATGAAAQVASAGPLRPLAFPLLLLALLEALVLLALFATRWCLRRCEKTDHARVAARSRWWMSPERRYGLFTVPVGCAVIATGLSAYRPSAALGVALGSLAVAIVSALALGGLLDLLVLLRKPGVAGVDGTWFLGPAAALAIAISLVALQTRLPMVAPEGIRVAALAWCAAGAFGYGAVLLLAAARVRQAGLGRANRAPWWISAGCGGLTAAAAGRVAAGLGPLQALARPDLAWVALVTWAVGSVLLVPILIGSSYSLWTEHWPPRIAPWPPTFSTGVYALGSDQVGRVWHLQAVSAIGQIAGIATVLFWAATSALHVWYIARLAQT